MQPILVCGFEPYGGWAVNPSGELARMLGQVATVTSAVLPVSYCGVDSALDALLDQSWAAVLLLGRWPGETLLLERLALNLDDSPQADVDRQVRQGHIIAADGPAAYWSSLPLARFEQRLLSAGLPVAWSRDAGGYICNHVFYRAAHALSGTATPCGLIHVPAGLAIAAQAAGLRDCLALLREDQKR